MNARLQIGILALQGAVEPHARLLGRIGASPVYVRKPEQLSGLAGIILPGGESTAMIHLLKLNRLWEPLREFVQTRPVLGVCAGAILLARKVTHPEQESLGAIDIEIARNAYGRQVDSFTAELKPGVAWEGTPIEGVFIRAPRIQKVGAGVDVLFEHKGEPVLVAQGRCLAGTFHPELTDSIAVHHYFITQCEAATPWTTASPNTSASLSVN
ncbi:pyridoxal 5'-phosphate synthase glutaminase subunit PdxT [bacterium]|nr:pyridoxal 5'-phosphate synthase glutaminase subunit PdxT [bacterium]